jgi:hypothetical protein
MRTSLSLMVGRSTWAMLYCVGFSYLPRCSGQRPLVLRGGRIRRDSPSSQSAPEHSNGCLWLVDDEGDMIGRERNVQKRLHLGRQGVCRAGHVGNCRLFLSGIIIGAVRPTRRW